MNHEVNNSSNDVDLILNFPNTSDKTTITYDKYKGSLSMSEEKTLLSYLKLVKKYSKVIESVAFSKVTDQEKNVTVLVKLR